MLLNIPVLVGVVEYASDGPYDLATGQQLTTAELRNVLDKNGNVTVWITAFLK